MRKHKQQKGITKQKIGGLTKDGEYKHDEVEKERNENKIEQ